MSWKNLDHHVIAELIREQGPRFGTRAISDAARMPAAHPIESRARDWRDWVGRCISENHGIGVIPRLRKVRHSGGQQHWERVAAGAEVAPVAAAPAAPSRSSTPPVHDADPLGPQSASDSAFTARMRLHQSRYRHERLGVPCGTGPQPRSTRHYCNMLRLEDAQRGANFLSPEIFAVVQERLVQDTDRVEPYRLLHNMLSSQPMCFNLFGPLVRDHALASRLVSAMLGETVELVDVRIEHAPRPAEEYLADRTSFDAIIAYAGAAGPGFVGIETKLTEPFSPKSYDRPEYRRWMRPGGPWRDPECKRVAAVVHNQLWRDHLLAVALREHPRSSFVEGRNWLVRHPGDESCGRVVAGYQELLWPGEGTFADWPLDRLLEVWEGVAPEAGGWLGAFRERVGVGYSADVRAHGGGADPVEGGGAHRARLLRGPPECEAGAAPGVVAPTNRRPLREGSLAVKSSDVRAQGGGAAVEMALIRSSPSLAQRMAALQRVSSCHPMSMCSSEKVCASSR